MNLEEELCPHDVATLLKEYFRDLPDPLLCKDLYQAFIQTQSKYITQKVWHVSVNPCVKVQIFGFHLLNINSSLVYQ